MKLKNVSKENIGLIEKLELFTSKSQLIDFVAMFKDNKRITAFIETYNRAKVETRIELNKYILKGLTKSYDKALFIQNSKVTQFFKLLDYETLKNLQERYFIGKVKPDDFNGETHVFSILPYLLMEYDKEMTFLNSIDSQADMQVIADLLKPELEKIEARVKNKDEHETIKLSFTNRQKEILSQYKLNKYELMLINKAGFNEKEEVSFTYAFRKAVSKLHKLYTRKADILVKEKFKNLSELTYEGMIKDYFGVEIDPKYEMKLSKQLGKKKVKFTQREIQYFGEIKKWFDLVNKYMLSSIDNYLFKKNFTLGKLYIDKKDFIIPDIVDAWAFRGSCNASWSSAGRTTNLFLKDLGFKYLKIYGLSRNLHTGKTELSPFARAYFYQNDEGEIGHTGGYSDIEKGSNKEYSTAYEFWTVLLCILFNKRVDDFTWNINGINLHTGDYYNWDRDELNIYANACRSTNYTKIGTSEDIFTGLGDNTYLKKRVVLYDSNGDLYPDERDNYFKAIKKQLDLYGE